MKEAQRIKYLKKLREKCDKETIKNLIDYFIAFNGDVRSYGQTIGINLVIDELNIILEKETSEE